MTQRGAHMGAPRCVMDLARVLPAIPASARAGGTGATRDEPQQPEHQDDDRHPPQRLERETDTEQGQGQQKNKKKGNHFDLHSQPALMRGPLLT